MALFALLGFAYVPLGRHTGLEHVRAIAATPAAERAARELVQAGARLRQRITRELVASPKRDPGLPEPHLEPEPANARIVPVTWEADASAPWQSGS